LIFLSESSHFQSHMHTLLPFYLNTSYVSTTQLPHLVNSSADFKTQCRIQFHPYIKTSLTHLVQSLLTLIAQLRDVNHMSSSHRRLQVLFRNFASRSVFALLLLPKKTLLRRTAAEEFDEQHPDDKSRDYRDKLERIEVVCCWQAA
jgi:hypothetical protein